MKKIEKILGAASIGLVAVLVVGSFGIGPTTRKVAYEFNKCGTKFQVMHEKVGIGGWNDSYYFTSDGENVGIDKFEDDHGNIIDVRNTSYYLNGVKQNE
ncbi:hypothetical protein HY212_01930 [Candidatus Pacearchaeota archaeon]|nr:hypothetical protein [Candidatus Pacearchaeota archaeon]